MIQVTDLHKKFKFHAGFFAAEDKYVHAVNGVSFSIKNNEIYGLVGESGCGKTTTARLLVNMYSPDQGGVEFIDREGQSHSLNKLQGKELKAAREKVQYIFQDPARSLNPRMSIKDILLAGYRYSSHWPGLSKASHEAAAILEDVGLKADDLNRRPPDFSGGQRQRISIARALIMKPEVLICDEVVSALDVSIQSQILKLLLQLKEEHKLSMLFISHDLAVVSYICDRVGVMYRGLMMEEGPAKSICENPAHSYTQYLYSSIPSLGQKHSVEKEAFQQYRQSFDPTSLPKDFLKKGWKSIGKEHFVADQS